ncbi:unnamed protein product, partial [Bubo scandiacus]
YYLWEEKEIKEKGFKKKKKKKKKKKRERKEEREKEGESRTLTRRTSPEESEGQELLSLN